MAGLTKVEEFLIGLGLSYQEIAPQTWLVDDEEKGLPGVVVSVADPIVLIRANIMSCPTKDREAFFAELLKLNGENLLHGAYALDGDEVILVDTLEYAGMDKDEFRASLEALGLALSENHEILSRFKKD
jgi:hypothetical protein